MNKQTVLITGACGFAGRYMCQYLKSLGESPVVIGLDLSDNSSDCDIYHSADMSDDAKVNKIIKEAKPDFIIHLAGIFGTDNFYDIYRSNVVSAITIYEAVNENCPDTVIVSAGSAAEYGALNSNDPVTEDTTCKPVSRYGISKLMATELAMFYHRTYGLNVSVVRPFQLIGKGVSSRLAPGAFSEQLRNAIAGDSKIIKVGNLESSRDFLDIHDAVEAIWSLCKKPSPGQIFNLCSGNPLKMSKLLDMMIDVSGVGVEVEVDPSRLRNSGEVSMIYGSYEKIFSHCGWKPKREINDSLVSML